MSRMVHDSCELGIRSTYGVAPVELIEHSPDVVVPLTFAHRFGQPACAETSRSRRSRRIQKSTSPFCRISSATTCRSGRRTSLPGESYPRAYAVAIGLDPREVIKHFRREFLTAGATKPCPSIAQAVAPTPATIPILAVTFAVAYTIARWLAPVARAPARVS